MQVAQQIGLAEAVDYCRHSGWNEGASARERDIDAVR